MSSFFFYMIFYGHILYIDHNPIQVPYSAKLFNFPNQKKMLFFIKENKLYFFLPNFCLFFIFFFKLKSKLLNHMSFNDVFFLLKLR